MDQRGEVAVAGTQDEGRDVVALEAELDRVNSHLDVGRVLTDRTHPLRDLDQLDVVAGQHAPVFVEPRPVGVGPPHDDPSPLGERVGNRPKVEHVQMKLFPRADREVLVVEEQCDPLFVVGHAVETISATGRLARRDAS